MKYMRKTPVEAIQWNGDNQKEVSEFVERVSRVFCTQDNEDGMLTVGYLDSKQNNHIANIPKFGWVVIEGKTLQFFKDDTFKHTFKAAEEDNNGIDWAGMTDTINKAFKGFDDIFKGFHGVPKEKIQEAVDMNYNKPVWKIADKAIKKFDDFYVEQMKRLADGKTGEYAEELINRTMQLCHISCDEAVDMLCEGLEESLLGGKASDKDAEKVIFDSVLDEMKELHAKKNADYGDAAHVNFLKYGPVASLSRLSEKMQRAENIFLSGKCEVKDEPLTETLIDIAITSAMLYMELKNKDNGTDKD